MSLAVIGWLGTIAYLVNHALLSFGRIDRGTAYYAANAIAAAAVTASSLALQSWQAVVVNGFWVLASVAALAGVTFVGGRWASARGLLMTCALIAAAGVLLSLSDRYLALSTVGWAAALLFCGAYFLFAVGHLEQRTFLLCNTVAAFGLVPVLALDNNWPVVTLELVWGLVSLIGWLRVRVDASAAVESGPPAL